MRKEESSVRFVHIRMKELDERCRQRLHEELEMDEESIDVIMNLRSQVIALQERLREMEAMLEIYQTVHNSRLVKYREVFYEADWEDS